MLTRSERMIVALFEIADGLVTILTFASVRYNLAFKMTAKYAMKHITKEKEDERNYHA